MNIYDLLRKLVRAAARSSSEFTAKQAMDAVDLINTLEKNRAFGTLVNLEKGEYKQHE